MFWAHNLIISENVLIFPAVDLPAFFPRIFLFCPCMMLVGEKDGMTCPCLLVSPGIVRIVCVLEIEQHTPKF